MSEIPKELEALAGVMTIPAFGCLISILNWARTFQAAYDGNLQMNPDHADALMLWVNGVGPDPMAWNNFGPTVLEGVQDEYAQWTTDSVYRDANPFVYAILKRAAPALAAASKGAPYRREAHVIINEQISSDLTFEPPSPTELTEAAVARERDAAGIEKLGAVNGTPGGPQSAAAPSRPARDPFARVGSPARRT